MIKVKRIDHVAIAVGDIEETAGSLNLLFGVCSGAREFVAEQQTDVAFLHTGDVAGGAGNATALELIAPLSESGGTGNPGLARFLERRGPGLHHICFEVDDLPGALGTLKAAGVRLIDESPRPGARGHMVAFIHPASTGGILFELCATRNGAKA